MFSSSLMRGSYLICFCDSCSSYADYQKFRRGKFRRQKFRRKKFCRRKFRRR